MMRDDITKILAACDEDLEGRRDAAMLLLVAYGVTARQVVKLRIPHLTVTAEEIRIVVPPAPEVVISVPGHVAVVQAWIDARAGADLPPSEGSLFVLVYFSRKAAGLRSTGAPADEWMVQVVLQRRARLAGISPPFPTVEALVSLFSAETP